MDHFIQALQKHSNVSVSSPHLLIMDRHSSHVTVDVVRRACVVGLHLLTLPSHYSHAMQLLEVAVFKPFKGAFRVYRDAWTLQNRGKGAKKEVLASWTSKALKRALTEANIEAGFCKIGIYPLNPSAMDSSMGPSSVYSKAPSEGEGSLVPSQESPEAPTPVSIQEVLLEEPPLPCTYEQYVVHLGDSEGEGNQPHPVGEEVAATPQDQRVGGGQGGISGLLTLPTLLVCRSRPATAEPFVDFSKSILLTSDAYLSRMEHMSAQRTDAAKAKDVRKVAIEECKRKCEEDRLVQMQKKQEREQERSDRAREKAYWAEIAHRGWGNDLQARMKSSIPPPPSAYRGVYVGSVPGWCISNQRRRSMLLDLRRGGASRGRRRPIDTRAMTYEEHSALYGPAE
jgi:hypothetical protein